ncbi:MAG: phosphatidate cytidylyltransferase [Bacteroidales bacterium]|nr:phosphatidate cytidylyltransferase [Bacteroidales bacterium]
MNTVLKRILITIIGVPLMLGIIFFLDHFNFLALMIVVAAFTILGSYELKGLISGGISTDLHIPPWLTFFILLASYSEIFYFPELPLLMITSILLISVICVMEIFSGHVDNFNGSVSRLTSHIFILFYPSIFVTFIIWISSLEHASWFLMLVFLLIFTNDVFAYIFGMLLGGSSRNLLKASPKKSLVGFIGGLLMTIIIGYTYLLVIPDINQKENLFAFGILFFIISITANIGDLVVSVIKRSVHVKDSGSLIPGRGGILDTMDSIVFSVPFFYLYILLFIQV